MLHTIHNAALDSWPSKAAWYQLDNPVFPISSKYFSKGRSAEMANYESKQSTLSDTVKQFFRLNSATLIATGSA